MRLAFHLAVVAVLAAAVSPACSSSDEAAIITGGGGATTGSDAGLDAQAEASAPVCEAFGGAYLGDGTCTPGALSFPTALCVRQTDCDLVAKTNADQTYAGAAVNGVLRVTTNTPADETCTGNHTAGVVALHCSGAAKTQSCDGKVTPVPLPATGAPCCDLHAHDCGAGKRCQPVDTEVGAIFLACIDDDGTIPEGGDCKRSLPSAAAVGHDACKAGFYCTEFATPTPEQRRCRRLCLLDDDCSAGQACFGFGGTPWAGVCVETCALFDPNACAAGTTCRVEASHDSYGLLWNLRCGAVGQKQAGDACSQPEDCGADLACVGGACEPYCDSTHACPGALTCMEYSSRKAANFGTSLGQCH